MDEAYRIAQDRGVTGCLHGGQGAARGPQAGPPTGAGITCEQYFTPVAVVGAVPCAAGDRRGELLQVMLRDPSTGVRAADVARTVATRGCGPAIERGARTPPHALSVARQGTSEDALSTLRPQASRRLGCGRGSGRRALSRLHPAEAWGGVTSSGAAQSPRGCGMTGHALRATADVDACAPACLRAERVEARHLPALHVWQTCLCSRHGPAPERSGARLVGRCPRPVQCVVHAAE